MDIRKILKKVPAMLDRVKESKSIDGKVTLADLALAMELVQIAFGQSVVQAARGRAHTLDTQGNVLNPQDFRQMQDYLKDVATGPMSSEAIETAELVMTQSEAGLVINPAVDNPEGNQGRGLSLAWIPVGKFILSSVIPVILKRLKKS